MSRLILIQLVAAAIGGFVAWKKGRNWAVWALACFFVPLVVLVVAFLPPVLAAGSTKQCTNCGHIIPADDAVCKNCQVEFPIEMHKCPKCGKYISEKERCPDCG